MAMRFKQASLPQNPDLLQAAIAQSAQDEQARALRLQERQQNMASVGTIGEETGITDAARTGIQDWVSGIGTDAATIGGTEAAGQAAIDAALTDAATTGGTEAAAQAAIDAALVEGGAVGTEAVVGGTAAAEGAAGGSGLLASMGPPGWMALAGLALAAYKNR